MNLLTRAIYPAIGKYRGLLDDAVGIVELVSARAAKHCSRLVVVGICKHAALSCHVLCGEHILALGISGASVCLLLAIANPLLYLQMRPGYRLSCCGVHHHVAYLSVGLGLGYGVHVCNMIQRAHHLSLGVALKLHHIHAHGQPLQLHRVVKLLVVLARVKLLCLAYHRLSQQWFNLTPALLCRWRVFKVALALHGIHRHCQLL